MAQWVQLLRAKQISERGKPVMRYPGDWVNVGNQIALTWIADGSARSFNFQALKDGVIAGAGIITDNAETAATVFADYEKLPVRENWPPSLEYERNIVYGTSLQIQSQIAPVGLGLLDTWDICVPLADYDTLAVAIGLDDERELTRSVIHDLRMPVYETRLMFVKRNRDTERLFSRWNEERERGPDERLSFLRALYRTPLLILALPVTWLGKNVG